MVITATVVSQEGKQALRKNETLAILVRKKMESQVNEGEKDLFNMSTISRLNTVNNDDDVNAFVCLCVFTSAFSIHL